MKRILALLALISAPVVGQVCDQAFNLRSTACPAGALDCTNKGSTLTSSEVDVNFVNLIDLCKPFDVAATAVTVKGVWTYENGLTLGSVDATSQLILPSSDDAVTPTLAFGGDAGIYEATGTDELRFAGAVNAKVASEYANSWGLRHANADATTPSLLPNQADSDTGIGHGAADALSLVAGGVEGLRLTEATTVQMQLPSYGSGTFTGVDAKWLAVTSAGVVIEEDPPGGTGDITDVGDCAGPACFTSGSPDAALTFDNATSGTVTLQTVAGALGAVTVSLPAETGTVCTTGSVCTGYEASGAAGFSDSADPVIQNTTGSDVHIGDGAGTLTGKLEIGGDTDQPQLVVEGHSTQTSDVMVVQNDADSELLSVDNSGNLTLAGAVAAAATATPSVVFDDSDTTVETTDARIQANATDAVTAQEDVDLTFAVQVNSVLTDRVQIDADGPTSFLNSEALFSNLGIEFTESDTNPTCAAGDYGIFADLSETKLKKCEDGVTADIGSGAGGGAFSDASDPIVQNTTTKEVQLGDGAGTLAGKVEIGGDANEPQLIVEGFSTQTDSIFIIQNDADTELFSVDNDGTVNVGGSGSLIQGDGAGDLDIDANGQNVTLGDGGSTNYVAVSDGGAVSFTGTGAIAIPSGAAFPGAPNTGDIFRVTDDTAVGDCDSAAGSAVSLCYYTGAAWASLGDGGSGSDTNAVKEFYFAAAALRGGMAPDDSFPALTHEEGTNIDIDVLAYDDTTDECAGGTFAVPSDIDTSGSATFRIRWYSGTAIVNDAMFDFRWHEVGDNESWDGALTTEEAGAITTAGTVDLITLDTWTETLSTLAWAANDVIEFLLCRDADSTGTGTDNLVGDAYVIDFAIEVPRA